ncbi:MAG: NAD(P)H-binding protein [Flammeovirgaceae bacterium]
MSSMFANSEIKTISILGCGWLGMSLAKDLIAEGYEVKGSTTHQEKLPKIKEIGATPFLIKLLPEPEGDRLPEFFDSDLLIICIPPGTRSGMADSYHPTQIKYLLDDLEKSTISKVIYISATSVYPTNNGEARETDQLNPVEAVNKSILLAEHVLIDNDVFQCTILRCGGLMGYDRIPGKYFAGEKNLKTGSIPVNYVHRDDVIRVIKEVFKQNIWNEVYNVVAPHHPTRKEIYLKNAKTFGFEAPTFDDSAQPAYKTVSSYKLLVDFQFLFKYPNPLEFAYNKEIQKTTNPDDPHEQPDMY